MTLKDLVDVVLPSKLGINSTKILLLHGEKILYERDDELSDEEVFVKNL